MTQDVSLDGAYESARYLEDLSLGTSWTTRGRTITEADLLTYSTWSGDMHPLHTDEEYARTTQFGTRIFNGPGVLAIAFGLEMTLGWKMGSVIAFLGIEDWRLVAPVLIGDTIHVREEIVENRPSRSKPDRGVVKSKVQVVNQHGVVVQEGLWVILMSTRSA